MLNFAAHNQGQSKTLFYNKRKKKCTLCANHSLISVPHVMCSARTRLFNTTWLRPLPLQEKKTVELFPLRYKCSTERGNICTLGQAWSVRANRWAGDSCRKLYQDFALSSRLSLTAATKMPKCPKCEKEVYFGKI